MSSNEEYLDSLLKSIEQKEASIQEAGIVNDLAELDMLQEPVDFSVEEELQDVFAVSEELEDTLEPEVFNSEQETLGVSEDDLPFHNAEDLSFLNTEDLSEEIYLEEHTGIPEELLFSNVEPEEEVRVKPEIVVQSQDATVLDILKSNPDMLIFPEDLEDIFSNIGSNFEENQEDAEVLADEADANDIFEADEVAGAGLNVDAGDAVYAEHIQDMAEDDIMRLLQQSADVSVEPDNAGIDIDALFDDMTNNGTLAQIQEMMDKAENNEPVSGEIDEMIQHGLTSGDEGSEGVAAPVMAPKEILGKIRVGFANIFKKETDNKEKKEKKKKERKSLFSKRGKKNKKDKNKATAEKVDTISGESNFTDLLSWDGADTPMADVPMWDYEEDIKSETAKQPKISKISTMPKAANTDKAQDMAKTPDMPKASDVLMTEEDIELAEMRKMAQLMKMSEQQKMSEVLTQPVQSDMSMLWDAIGNVEAEAVDMPDFQDISDFQDEPDFPNMSDFEGMSELQDTPGEQEMFEDPELAEMRKMAELMKMSEQQKMSNVAEQPAQSDMSMLWDAIGNINAEDAEMPEMQMLWDAAEEAESAAEMPLMPENMDEGLPSLDDLFGAAPEVQTNNANAGDIADLLSSLENDDAEIDFGGSDIDLFAGMEQENYESEPVEQDGAHDDVSALGDVKEADIADEEETPKKKRNPFKFNLFSRKKKESEENLLEQDATLSTEETSGQADASGIEDVLGQGDAFGQVDFAEQADEDVPMDDLENGDIFGNEDIFGEVSTSEADAVFDEKITIKKEKKPGFFKRLFTLLTEEDEEIDALFGGKGKKAGVDELGATSEENKEAMAQLDKEGSEDKKKKKGKKGKKDKKGEIKEGNGEENEDEEEPVEDTKKKKKPKKEKKEKKQKEPKFYDDSPKIPKRKIKSTFFAAATVLVAIVAICMFIPEMFETISARKAYYNGDYETSYRTFYGKELSESDEIIFEQSEFMLALQRRVDSYYNFMAVNDEERAVEVLIQEVANQKQVMYEAEKHDLQDEAEASYNDVLQILREQYGVSEAEAVTISEYRQDALFTLHIRAIVAGEEFVCPDYLLEYAQTATDDVVQEEEFIEETLEDILPEEEELTEEEFEEGTN